MYFSIKTYVVSIYLVGKTWIYLYIDIGHRHTPNLTLSSYIVGRRRMQSPTMMPANSLFHSAGHGRADRCKHVDPNRSVNAVWIANTVAMICKTCPVSCRRAVVLAASISEHFQRSLCNTPVVVTREIAMKIIYLPKLSDIGKRVRK